MPDNPTADQHFSPGGDHQGYASLLRRVDLFAGLDRVTLSKLAARLQPLGYPAQSIIFRQGEPGDAFFLIASGSLGVYPSDNAETETRLNVLQAGEAFGEMALLNNIPRTATIKAETDCEVLRLERRVFLELVRDQPAVALEIAATLSRRLATMLHRPAPDEATLARSAVLVSSAQTEAVGSSAKRAGWRLGRRGIAFVTAFAIFTIGWLLSPPNGLSLAGWHALVLLLVVLPLLVLNALIEGVLALLLACMWVVFGVANSSVALSGFASSSWVLVVSVLIIGAAISQTGVLYRLALAAVSHIRGGFAGEASALATAGVLLSPAVPNTTSRIVTIAPMLRELVDALGYEPKSNAAAGLAMAALVGFGQMTAATLTSGTNTVLVAGLLAAHERGEINWVTWTIYGAPFNLILFLGVLATILWHYRPRSTERRPLSERAKSLELQRAVLGPMSRDEKIALSVVIGMLVGFVTQPLHHIEAGWIAVIAVSALSALRVVNVKTLRAVNWNQALLFGILVSFAKVFEHVGLDRWVASHVAGDMVALSSSRIEFVVVLALFCFAIRFILPSQAAAPLVTITLAPVASAAGIDPYIVGLISVVACNCFFLAYQSAFYLALEAGTGHALFTRAQVLPTSLAFAAWILIAAALSVPIWHTLGLM